MGSPARARDITLGTSRSRKTLAARAASSGASKSARGFFSIFAAEIALTERVGSGAFSSNGVKDFRHEPDPSFDFHSASGLGSDRPRSKHAAGRVASDRRFHGIRRRSRAVTRSDDGLRRFGCERGCADDDGVRNDGLRIVRTTETDHGRKLPELRGSGEILHPRYDHEPSGLEFHPSLRGWFRDPRRWFSRHGQSDAARKRSGDTSSPLFPDPKRTGNFKQARNNRDGKKGQRSEQRDEPVVHQPRRQ